MNETRKRLTNRLVFSLALCALLVPSAWAFGGGGPGGGPHRGGPGGHHGPPIDRILERHAERLGLDDETRERVREISEESRQASEGIHEQMRALHEALRAALEADEPDEDAVMDLAEDIGDLRTQGTQQRLRTMLRIRAELTPEQRAQLVEIREERRERRGPHGRFGHRGRRGDRGGDPQDATGSDQLEPL